MPQIVSHRGESQDRPENTMAAFRLAFERGVDGVECDVYATTDGVPVIIHDGTTGRTAGSGTNLTVTASSWDDLKDVRVGAYGSWIGTEWEGETLPKFEDYLALLASNETTKCVVELKGNGANGLISSVVAAVQAQSLATKDRVMFIAFDANLIRAVRQALPDYEAWLLLSGGTYTGASMIASLADCNATGVDIYHAATYTAADVTAASIADSTPGMVIPAMPSLHLRPSAASVNSPSPVMAHVCPAVNVSLCPPSVRVIIFTVPSALSAMGSGSGPGGTAPATTATFRPVPVRVTPLTSVRSTLTV